MLDEILIGVAALAVGTATGYLAGRNGVPGLGGRADTADQADRMPEAPRLAPETTQPDPEQFSFRGFSSDSAAADWAQAQQGAPWESAGGGKPAGTVQWNSDVLAVPQTATADSQSSADRDRLVLACVDLADRLRDRQPALYQALCRDLKSVGVTVLAPDGERFDAHRHNAVQAEHVADPAQHLLIAETMKLGYEDRGVQVRVPDVVVYRAE
jgi:hypothetical protein